MPIDRTPQTYEEWKVGMKELARNTNVVAKISGLGMVDHEWTVDSLRPYVLGTIESMVKSYDALSILIYYSFWSGSLYVC